MSIKQLNISTIQQQEGPKAKSQEAKTLTGFKRALGPIVILIGLVVNGVSAQDCQQQFENAERAYFNGDLGQVEALLQDCLDDLSRQDKLAAYRLIVLSNLFLNNKDLAEQAMEDLLSVDPEYQLSTTDPPEFVKLYQSFNTDPVFSYGPKGGWNTSLVKVKESTSADGQNDNTNFNGRSGFQIGGTLSYHLKPKIWLNLDLMAQQKNFESQRIFLGTHTVVSQERQLTIGLPLTVGYVADFKSLKFMVEAGYALDWLVDAQATVRRENATAGRTIVDLGVDLKDFRQPLQQSAVLGFRVIRKIPRGFLSLDFSYKYGISNQAKVDQRYRELDLVFIYAYVDDDFRVSSFNVSLDCLFLFYNPKKKVL